MNTNPATETKNKSTERRDGFANITFKPVAGFLRTVPLKLITNFANNLLAEVGRVGNLSNGRGGYEQRFFFEPLAAIKRVHIPGSTTIANILSSPPSVNISFPQVNLPSRAAVANWTAQPVRIFQQTIENWRRQGSLANQRRGKVIVRSSRELATLLEQVRELIFDFVISERNTKRCIDQGVPASQMDIRGRSQPWRQNEFGELLSEDALIASGADSGSILRADGRTAQLRHPVLEAIWERARSGSKPGHRSDNYRIALAIEGGGLRGSVTAGMASAVTHLGLADAFDMVIAALLFGDLCKQREGLDWSRFWGPALDPS
jgi:hypothetical protein